MADQLIPLTTSPNQQRTVITVSIDNAITTLQLGIRFSYMSQYWVMTVWDQNGNALLDSLPLVTGSYPAANVLEQHAYLNIGSAYVVNAGNFPADYPGVSSLGTSFVLIWSDTPN